MPIHWVWGNYKDTIISHSIDYFWQIQKHLSAFWIHVQYFLRLNDNKKSVFNINPQHDMLTNGPVFFRNTFAQKNEAGG